MLSDLGRGPLSGPSAEIGGSRPHPMGDASAPPNIVMAMKREEVCTTASGRTENEGGLGMARGSTRAILRVESAQPHAGRKLVYGCHDGETVIDSSNQTGLNKSRS